MKKNILTKTVWILSFVSFFTDVASEMLYPILPLYLQAIGFSVFYIGILEGIAEATASFSKGYFGKLSDSLGKRVPFVQIGYSLSAISKPLMGFFIQPLVVFLLRTMDRFGKGVRTSARDAILVRESTHENRATVFGFHRSMDTLGAVIGPCLALIFLYYYPNEYQIIFLLSFAPGFFAVLLSFLLKDKEVNLDSSLSGNKDSIDSKPKKPFEFINPFSFLSYWKKSPKEYKFLIIGLLVFAWINSSDMFLLLKVKQITNNDSFVIASYIFYNLVYALLGLPLGLLGDKIGLQKTYALGLLLFSLVYLGMGWIQNFFGLVVIFIIYGAFSAATEGIAKAWISNTVDKNEIATAIGFYTTFQGIFTMFSSILAGWIWQTFGNNVLFYYTGFMGLILVLYFFLLPIEKKYN